MNTKRKYNSMICKIEDTVDKNIDIPTKELADNIAFSENLSSRDLSTIFMYMTNSTLHDYIRDRRMIAAYRYLIKNENSNNIIPSINRAIEISGYDNQSSFTKRFTARFGISPKKAMQQKDINLISKPLTWDVISDDLPDYETEQNPEESMEEKTLFGITQEQYDKVMKATELQEFYGFDPVYSNLAFNIAQRYSYSLEDSFAFISSINDFIEELDDLAKTSSQKNTKNSISKVESIAFSSFMQYMYFECDISVSLAYITLERSKVTEKELLAQPPLLLHTYAHTNDIDFNYFKKAYDYLIECTEGNFNDIEFDEYIDLIARNIPYYEAIDMVDFIGDFDMDEIRQTQLPSEDEIDPFDFIERMADEENRWKNTLLDLELDEENSIYELDDMCDSDSLDF